MIWLRNSELISITCDALDFDPEIEGELLVGQSQIDQRQNYFIGRSPSSFQRELSQGSSVRRKQSIGWGVDGSKSGVRYLATSYRAILTSGWSASTATPA